MSTNRRTAGTPQDRTVACAPPVAEHAPAARRVCVTAPSRLHFGMFSFGRAGVRQFGGVGAMIDAPVLELRISPSECFQAQGVLADNVASVVERLCAAGWFDAPPSCLVRVESAPPRHVGLGSGTQLALAVAAGLCAYLGRASPDVETLARATMRGRRSAIGLHGFARGGLLVESGKLGGGEISPLAARVELPASWRFVLLRPRGEEGLSGEAERRAFQRLPPVPVERTERLMFLAHEELLPAAAAGDFPRFSAALYEFNREAGWCFAAQQGGPFASARVRHIVDEVRALGAGGAAQSSWGPTVAVVLPDLAAAHALISRLSGADLEITIAAANNHGARVTMV